MPKYKIVFILIYYENLKKDYFTQKNLIYPSTRFLKSPKWYRTRIFDLLAGFLENFLYQTGSPHRFFPKVLYDPVQDLLAPRDVSVIFDYRYRYGTIARRRRRSWLAKRAEPGTHVPPPRRRRRRRRSWLAKRADTSYIIYRYRLYP